MKKGIHKIQHLMIKNSQQKGNILNLIKNIHKNPELKSYVMMKT